MHGKEHRPNYIKNANKSKMHNFVLKLIKITKTKSNRKQRKATILEPTVGLF